LPAATSVATRDAQDADGNANILPKDDHVDTIETSSSNLGTRAPESYQGRCFCGAVRFSVTGKPAAMGYCHCESCRSWSAAPVNAFTLWAPDAVRLDSGGELVDSYHKTERSVRKWCTKCGGHLLTEHPGWGVVDVYAASIPDLPFTPQLHVNYQETTLRIRDGLPKMKDMPAEMGGSGVVLAE